MIHIAISMPGKFYTDAITKALEKTGNFRVRPLIVPDVVGENKRNMIQDMLQGYERVEKGPPDVALLGVSVYPGYTLRERQNIIQNLRANTPECKIVVFIDELVSQEQTDGVKNLKQARLIDGFLYASGTMEYLIATLESI